MPLRDLYIRYGIRGVRRLLSGPLEVVERLEAPRMQVCKIDGEVELMRRGEPVNVVDSVLDPGIRRSGEALAALRPAMLEEGVTYEIAFPDRSTIPYKKAAGPVLLSRRRGSAVLESISELNSAAKRLRMSPPPVLWRGKLTEEQADQVFDLIRKDVLKPVDARELMAVLGCRPALNESVDDLFGGLVLRLRDYGKIMSVKVDDTLFEAARLAELEQREPVDMHGIVLCDFVEFFEHHVSMDSLTPTGGALDERLLSAVQDVYMAYVADRGHAFDGVRIADRGFEVDESLLREDVRGSFDGSDNNRKIFQMLLQSLYSPKRKPTGTLTESVLASVARVRERITDKIARSSGTSWPTYEEYLIMKK